MVLRPPDQCGQTAGRLISDASAVVGPLQEGLALPPTTAQVTGLAILLDLADVPAHRPPPPNLSRVFDLNPAPEVIAAIPLKPTSRVIRVDPALRAPDR